jgi:hypothetical protein
MRNWEKPYLLDPFKNVRLEAIKSEITDDGMVETEYELTAWVRIRVRVSSKH